MNNNQYVQTLNMYKQLIYIQTVNIGTLIQNVKNENLQIKNQ